MTDSLPTDKPVRTDAEAPVSAPGATAPASPGSGSGEKDKPVLAEPAQTNPNSTQAPVTPLPANVPPTSVDRPSAKPDGTVQAPGVSEPAQPDRAPAPTVVAPQPAADTPVEPVTPAIENDFAIHVGTVNGSGSQSANNVLIRSIMQMGVPVSGKNLFPSNIAGLPTWFTIRVNKGGWLGRKRDVDILIAMNADTAVQDLTELRPGTVCISPAELKLDKVRSDVVHYQVPFNELVVASTDNTKLRKLLVNMIYVGVVGHLLGMDFTEIEKAIKRQFNGKTSAIASNLVALNKGREWARQNLPKKDSFIVRRMNKTDGKILIDGNSAAAVGCLFAGVTVVAWYPITPSSSLCEHLQAYLEKHRVGADGKKSFAVVQAEDELAAIGMTLGAGWAGARAMTATSGPGISLMAEFVGLGYFTEIPAVIFDVQRVGPSTGLPTRTAQADLSFVYSLSHGDTRHIVLIPGTVEECYSMAVEAFDIADRFQTPVFVLSDLDLGMNNFLSDPFKLPAKPMDRGKVLTAEQITAAGKFERYRDLDGDGICYRTVPGTNHPQAGYFNRGSGHNEKGGYSEKPADYRNLMDRLSRKFDTARNAVPAPEVTLAEKAKIGIIAFGSSHHAVMEARHYLQQAGTETSYLRVRALPFNEELRKFVAAHDRVYVVEQNRDGQMRELITLELPELATRLRSIRHYNGLPIHARFISDAITEKEVANV